MLTYRVSKKVSPVGRNDQKASYLAKMSGHTIALDVPVDVVDTIRNVIADIPLHSNKIKTLN